MFFHKLLYSTHVGLSSNMLEEDRSVRSNVSVLGTEARKKCGFYCMFPRGAESFLRELLGTVISLSTGGGLKNDQN